MATSSFFKPLVVRQQDEAAWVKAFDTTEKIKRNKNYTINKLNKEAGRKVLIVADLICICIKHKIYNCPNGFISSYNLDLFIRFET